MKKYLFATMLLLLFSCERYKYHTGHFPHEVINFFAVNSQYNDFNSTAPFIFYRHFLIFSSDRNSAGGNFDLVGEKMFIDWSKTKGTLNIEIDHFDDTFDYFSGVLDTINSPCDELGPYCFSFQKEISYSEILRADLVFYANNCEGNYDIQFLYCELDVIDGASYANIKANQSIEFLNSTTNDIYPSLFGEEFFYQDEYGVDISKIKKIIFSSDRDGSFDIYEVSLPSGSELINTLKFETSLPTTKMALSSQYNDNCPFVNGKLLVFASDRPGGFGGYDLYYSEFKNGNWMAPKNFGERINTEYDEFRPITMHLWEFENNLMIFSSNRPGGKGGFDLYYTGIPQMIR